MPLFFLVILLIWIYYLSNNVIVCNLLQMVYNSWQRSWSLCHNVSSHWSPSHQSWRLIGSDWPHLIWHKEPWWWGEATIRICVRLREDAKKGDNPNIVTSYHWRGGRVSFGSLTKVCGNKDWQIINSGSVFLCI